MDIKIELLERSGIYCLMNIENGKRYIGSSKNLYNRLHSHLSKLVNNKSHNKHLQSSWNKHGKEKFIFFAIEYCDESIRFEKEQNYIDFMNPEYNFSKEVIANSNRVISDEQKAKISNTLKEKYKSGELKTYKQDHNWIKCYVYDIENYSLHKECKNLNEAFRLVGTKYSSKDRIDLSIYKKKYCISYEFFSSFLEIKNYVCKKLMYRTTNTDIKEYLISEDDKGILKYHKNIKICADYVNSSRSTLNKHTDATKENPYKIMNSNYKIYFSKEFIPFCAVY